MRDNSIPAAKPQRSRVPMIVLGVVVIGGAAIAGVTGWLGRDEVSTDDAFTDGHVVSILSQDSGAITDLKVVDNQFVHKGDLLAVIDQRNYNGEVGQAEGDLAAAKAQLDSAQVQLERTKAVAPAQLAAAQAQLESAQAQLSRAQQDSARQHRVELAATTRSDIDMADAGLLQAKAAVAQAQANVTQQNVVDQTVAVAAAEIARLKGVAQSDQAKLDNAKADYYNSMVHAPADGWITKKAVEIGTFVQPGSQLFSIVTPDVYVTGNFKEAQLERMRAGDKVTIKLDAYPQLKLTGHVDSIQLGTGSRFTAFPAENATGNFVKVVQRVPVKILIDGGLDPKLPLSLGLSAEPTVTVGE